jgi:hypothetical protein
MDRRRFIGVSTVSVLALIAAQSGCRGRQTAQVLKPGEADMVGSHTAGAETYKPLIDEAVAKLLARHSTQVVPVGYEGDVPLPGRRVCFVGVENKSSEELGDFKEQIYQHIDTRILESQTYQAISRRFVEAGLMECRLRPDQLFVPENMRIFTGVMEKQGQPFDYLLYATVTSGTTRSNADYQRDYVLTLEMINIRSGKAEKESAALSKGYNVSVMAKVKNFRPFK